MKLCSRSEMPMKGCWTVSYECRSFISVCIACVLLASAGTCSGKRLEETATVHGPMLPTLSGLHSCGGFDIGCKIIVSTVLEPPYMMLKPEGAFLAGNDRFEGYLADILQRLSSSIGFKYEIRLSRGVKVDDHIYYDRFLNGVISEVRRGIAHIGAGPLVVTNRTLEFVDFTQPFLSLRSSALLRRSSSSSSHLPQDHDSGQQRSHTITDHNQLLHSNYTYGVIHDGIAYHMLASSVEPVTRALWSRMATHWPRAFVHSLQEGVERAKRGGYAFIIDTPTAEYAASREPCDLYTTEPFLDVMSYAFVMRKADFRLRHVIDRELRKLKWNDELQTMFLRWWKSECVGKTRGGNSTAQRTSKELSLVEAVAAIRERKDGFDQSFFSVSFSSVSVAPLSFQLIVSCIFMNSSNM